MKIQANYSLENLNTFRLLVRSRWFVEYENESELIEILSDKNFRNQFSLHIGKGSNMLFSGDIDGVVLHSEIKGMWVVKEMDDSVLLRVGAAECWDDVVAFAVEKGWGGIENLSLIPGETGAAAVQNIGAFGMEINDVIDNVEAFHTLNVEKRIFSAPDCMYGYRTSIFKETDAYIIMYVTLRLQKKPVFNLEYGNLKEICNANQPATLQKIRETIIDIRRKKLPDPNKLSNAGSFFMNPIVTTEKLRRLLKHYSSMPYYPTKSGGIKLSAGWLIEQCGLKGKRFGQVGVYEHHALIIVNYGGATGNEIARLADHIGETVYQRFGLRLVPEVRYVG